VNSATPQTFFSDEHYSSDAVAGGGTTASEFKTPPFSKTNYIFYIPFLPSFQISSQKKFSKLTQNHRSSFEIRFHTSNISNIFIPKTTITTDADFKHEEGKNRNEIGYLC
jgi:hypothetical protein